MYVYMYGELNLFTVLANTRMCTSCLLHTYVYTRSNKKFNRTFLMKSTSSVGYFTDEI